MDTNWNWATDVNTKSQPMKDLKKKKKEIGENLSAPGLCKNFLDLLNVQSIKF